MAKVLKTTHEGILKIGQTSIRCFVLEDGRRLLSGRAVTKSMALTGRGQGMTRFLTSKSLKPFVTNDLVLAIENPIVFTTSSRGIRPTHGYEAWVLPELCNIVIEADDQGLLRPHQKLMAHQAKILVRAFATVGIVALVDEATGYQEVRDRLALNKILEKWIVKELLPWTKRFPNEFYKEMFRLKGWQYSPLSVKRPRVIGHYTNDIVYDRLEVGLLNRLKKENPKDEGGHRKSKHHQWLTLDIGHPKLRDHLQGVIALMRASANWIKFKRLLNRAYPKKGMTLELPLDDD